MSHGDGTLAANRSQRNWWVIPLAVFLALFAAAVIVLLLGYSQRWIWTGVVKKDKSGNFVTGKTLWDWLQLFALPITLAGIATLFNWALKRRELEIARQNRLSDQRIADDRNQEAALQAYLDRMGNLLAGLKLRSSEVESETRDLARAWTHAVVRKLDGERKGIVVRFLYESRLIDRFEPVIDISGADLRGANLCWANLIGVLLGSDRPVRGDLLERVAREIGGSVHHINGTDLTGADLGRASLHAAQLENVALENATLEWASLDGAVLTGAYCKGANLRHCSLTRANLRGCRLMGADLRDARLGSADLYGADLANANLSDADLRRATLDGANLAGAILQGATLDEASLEGSAITVEQLEQVASYEAVKWPSHITELGVALVRARHGVHE